MFKILALQTWQATKFGFKVLVVCGLYMQLKKNNNLIMVSDYFDIYDNLK